MHELRSITHIIDMHQLTKDPDHTPAGAVTTASGVAGHRGRAA